MRNIFNCLGIVEIQLTMGRFCVFGLDSARFKPTYLWGPKKHQVIWKVHLRLSFYTSFEADCGEALFEANRIFRVISREKNYKNF